MREWKFNMIKNLLREIYKGGEIEYIYDWSQFSKSAEEFNKNRKRKFNASL